MIPKFRINDRVRFTVGENWGFGDITDYVQRTELGDSYYQYNVLVSIGEEYVAIEDNMILESEFYKVVRCIHNMALI